MQGSYSVRYPDDVNVINLSPHFKGHELHCPCCKKLLVIPRLLIALENTSERLTPGNDPFIITSAVRCTEYQVALYQSINAQRRLMGLPPLRVPLVGYHVTGEAIDTVSVKVPGRGGSEEEAEFLAELREDGWVGIGIQKELKNAEGKVFQQAWTHLDVRRGAAATWYYTGGRG